MELVLLAAREVDRGLLELSGRLRDEDVLDRRPYTSSAKRSRATFHHTNKTRPQKELQYTRGAGVQLTRRLKHALA
jgi:hypothetical protein